MIVVNSLSIAMFRYFSSNVLFQWRKIGENMDIKVCIG